MAGVNLLYRFMRYTGSKMFKKHKFNTQEIEYASFDVVKLYPSVDTELLLEFLIKTIYSDNRPTQMLPRFRDENGNLIKPIPKTVLKNHMDFNGLIIPYTWFNPIFSI